MEEEAREALAVVAEKAEMTSAEVREEDSEEEIGFREKIEIRE